MQGDLDFFDSLYLETLKDSRCEVQTRRGRRHRTGTSGVDSLVSLPVSDLVGASNIGRQGCVADLFKLFYKTLLARKLDNSEAERSSINDRRLHAAGKSDHFADANPASGMDQRLPAHGLAMDLPQQQDLHYPTDVILRFRRMHARPTPEQSCRQYSRVVEDERVAP